MKKIKKYLSYILIIFLIIIQTFFVVRKKLQNDTFYSIKVGEIISQSGVNSLDIDTISWHENLKYCNPHWLNDLLIYLVYNLGEFFGIYILAIIESLILGILIFYISNKKSGNKWISLLITLFVLYVNRIFIAARAQLVSYILFLLEIYFIEQFISTKKNRYLVGLGIIALGLANVHMAVFPMYFVFLLPYIAQEIISKFLKKESYIFGKIEIKHNGNWKQLSLIVLIGIITGFLNPSGLTPFTYTIKTMMGVSTEYINEHSRLNFMFLKYNLGYIISFCIVGLIIIFPKVKIKLHDLFLLLGLILLSFIGIRHLALFVILSSNILVKYIVEILNILKNEQYKILKIGCYVLCTIMIFIVSFKYYEKNKNDEYIYNSEYPIKACEYIRDNLNLDKLKIFNTYADGSYLVLAGIPNFIDTRCDLYTAEFNEHLQKGNDIFIDCMKLVKNSSIYKEIFEKYDINACLVNKVYAKMPELENDSEFKNVYEDDYYIVYVKNEH